MKYLLDTHTFLWTMRAPGELPVRIRAILEDPKSDLLISVVVPWEMSIKFGIGKLSEAEIILRDFDRLVTEGGYTILETALPHVIESGQLPHYHRDPFDRLLVAQALDLRVPILSCDDILDRYGVTRIWT